MNRLIKQINELEGYIANYESKKMEVSNSTVGWQIAHSLKVINSVLSALKLSNPADYQWKFNKMRFVIFLLGSFPRGKAKAPKTVVPNGDISVESLKENIEKVRKNLSDWKSIEKNAHFPHPFFGILNKKSTLKFLLLHTEHHLKIIRDILK